jgi:hypothetical protein
MIDKMYCVNAICTYWNDEIDGYEQDYSVMGIFNNLSQAKEYIQNNYLIEGWSDETPNDEILGIEIMSTEVILPSRDYEISLVIVPLPVGMMISLPFFDDYTGETNKQRI